ncbi:MAG: flavocytochrome c [Firmicutes bacterium]|nr:flavocytochrome c [Bacillota bacterium]
MVFATACGSNNNNNNNNEEPGGEALTTDVLVIGGGGAGLAAATSAAENGADVILIEKAAFLGGNTVIAGGAFNSVNPDSQQKAEMNDALMADLEAILEAKESDFGDFQPTLVELKSQITEYLETGDTDVLFDSVELHMIHTYLGGQRTDLEGNSITGDLELVRVMCGNALDALKWLEGHGIEVRENVSTVLGALWPRTNSVGRGSSYIEVLEPAAKGLGVEIMLETRGIELIVEDGRVVGAKAEKADGTEIIINANSGVVVATGGYGENPEMRAEYNTYWKEMPLEMPSTNSPNITGDGIIMGKDIGANLVGMGFLQLMPSSHPVTGSLFSGVWGSAETQVFVNKDGKRFVNEYAERDVLASAALEQEEGLFFIITDQQIVGERDIEQMLTNGDVVKADTLEELAEELGIDVEAFLAEIEKYNSYVDNQKDPDFNKPNFGSYKVEVAPFYATPRSPSVHHTMGGLQIDTTTRVINVDGEAIPGLYAAGEVTGGIHAGNRLGGNAQADIMVFGRIAGESAALKK